MLFRRTDPDPRQLIEYIVDRARSRGITLNRTKLVKLLYLVDVEREASRRDSLSGFDWVFYHYGPYAFELIDMLAEMEGNTLWAKPYKEGIYYHGAKEAPDGDAWPPATKIMVDHIVDEFGARDLNELLDHVYFHTGPMVDATRGERLDMSKARDYRERHYPALKAAPATADLSNRLDTWRSQNAKRFAQVQLDPPVTFLTGIDDSDTSDVDARGTLHVPEDTWI